MITRQRGRIRLLLALAVMALAGAEWKASAQGRNAINGSCSVQGESP
jgi:hypothetical protein